MIRGLYNGAAALDAIAKQQEQISSNLANLNTSGHRIVRFAVSQRENPTPEVAANELGPMVADSKIDFSNGRLHHTGRPLDASLVGDGFFVFEGPTGDLYSRAGQFIRDAESGTLVNAEGLTVKGESGPIKIPPNIGDHEITIGTDGTVSGGGEEIGRISIVAFEDNETLITMSQSIFQAGASSVETESSAMVNQFHQEHSNGNAVSELVSMIVGTRQYDAVQKATTAISEALREHIRA